MNRLGFALLGLIFLQWAVTLTVYYLIVKSAGANIEFYGLSIDGISKTISQIKSSATKSTIAMPTAVLLATLIANMVPFLICARTVDVSTKKTFMKPKVSASTTAIYGVAALGASIFGSIIVNIIASLLKLGGLKLVSPSINIPWSSPVGSVFMILTVVVAAPLTEEFICRGVLLSVFRRFGDIFAVVASSLVWALLHGNLVQGVPVFLMGLFFGMLALKADSIIPTVILHAINNFLSLIENSAIEQSNNALIFGFSVLNMAVLFSGVALISVFYKRFEFERKGENAHGFSVFFTCVPILIMILICVLETALSIKPV